MAATQEQRFYAMAADAAMDTALMSLHDALHFVDEDTHKDIKAMLDRLVNIREKVAQDAN